MPRLNKNGKRSSNLDPYRDRIGDMINTHNLSAIRILEEIRKQGYDGGYTILREYFPK